MKKKLLHTPEGVRDIYNAECEKKRVLQHHLHHMLKLYGYHDIETPTFEFFDIFSREIGTTPSKDLYKFFDREGNTLVLRPDFTPSIARCAAKYYLEEDMPIRMCYEGNAFINSSEYQGRLKEMTQMGAELIGDNTISADAEVIALVIELLLKAGLKDFQVEIGQIDFFKGLVEEAGLEEETENELRELISNKNYFGVEELFVDYSMKEKLKHIFLQLPQLFGTVEILKEAKELTTNRRAIEAIDRLLAVYEYLRRYGLEQYVSFDLGMLSKHRYYTGVIFKAYTYGTGEPIVKGGRYDHLLSWFGKEASAIGFVVLVDSLMISLSRQKIEIPIQRTNTILLYQKPNSETAITLTKQFRSNGMNIELIQKKEELTLQDYIAFGKRNHTGGIVYLKNADEIEVVSIETGEITKTTKAELLQ